MTSSNCETKILPSPILSVRALVENGLNHLVKQLVGNDNFDLDFGNEVNRVFGSPVAFRVSFLTSEPAHFRDGHSLHVERGEGFFDGIQFEVPNNRFNFFHRTLRLGDILWRLQTSSHASCSNCHATHDKWGEVLVRVGWGSGGGRNGRSDGNRGKSVIFVTL